MSKTRHKDARPTLELARLQHQRGEQKKALSTCERLLETAPDNAAGWAFLGEVTFGMMQFQRAVDAVSRALAIDPENREARENAAVMLLHFDKATDAEPHLRWLAEKFPSARVWNDLGRIVGAQGRQQEAAACFEQVVRLQPASAEARANFALACMNLGRMDLALESMAEAARLAPKNMAILTHLGSFLRATGDYETSASLLAQVIDASGISPETIESLTLALLNESRMPEAVLWGRQLQRLAPDSPGTHNLLGLILKTQGDIDAAEAAFRRAVEIDPRYGGALLNLSDICADRGRITEARHYGKRVLAQWPKDGLRIRLATLLPPIYESKDALIEARANLTAAVDRLLTETLRIDDPLREVGFVNFYLAYQGEPDRELNAKLGQIYAKVLPRQVPRAPRRSDGPPKVGFISRFLYGDHSVMKCFGPLVKALATGGLDVNVYQYGSQPLDADWARVVRLPADLADARQVLAGEGLDTLVYLDVGMDPLSYFLAFTRLADTQCVMGGHPITTGVPNMDHFLTSAVAETAQGQSHYTENLVQLDGTPTHFERPQLLPRPLDRSAFGLPADRTLYVNPMLLQKFHPDYDRALGEILRRDERGTVVLFKSGGKNWHELLRQRFARTIPDVLDRVMFLDPVPPAQFPELLRIADVVLDTWYFGGGTTAYLSLATGTPFVTWPTEHLKSRAVVACYRRMGLEDLAATSREQYIERAVAWGRDRDLREHIREQILARNDVLYGDMTCVQELLRFFTACKDKSRGQRAA